jgi:leader peptidase (prepilin peptidase)/N-methyltransferase
LIGLLVGGGSLLSVALGYELLTKQEGMGFGDVKLLAMLGAFLGWPSVFPTIFLGSVLGSIVGIPLMLIKKADRKLAIPFGPFLSAGALIYVYFFAYWDSLMYWYVELLQYWFQSFF